MSFVAEMIISYFNQNCHTYSSSPFFTFAEEQIIRKIIGKNSYSGNHSLVREYFSVAEKNHS